MRQVFSDEVAVSSEKPSFTAQSPKLATLHDTMNTAFEADDPNVTTKAFERSLVGAVRQIYTGLGQGDIDVMMQSFTEDVELSIFAPLEFGFRSRARGVEEARALVLHNFQLLEAQAPRITSVVAQGNVVVVSLRETGVVRATGRPYIAYAVQHFTFTDGKVSHFHQVAAAI